MTAVRKLSARPAQDQGEIPPQKFWTQIAWLNAGASPLMAWRRAARMSVSDLSAWSGVAVETIEAIEGRRHKPTRLEMIALAAVLGLGLGDLED